MKTPVILHAVASWLPPTQPWLYHMVRGLPEAGGTHHVVCERAQHLDPFAVGNLHVYPDTSWLAHFCAPRHWRHGLRRRPSFTTRLIEENRIDLVHSHFGHTGWYQLRAVARTGVRHLVSFYGIDISAFARQPRWRERYAQLFDSADRIISMGPDMSSRLRELGCPDGKLVVHRMGIPVESIPFTPRTRNADRPLRVLMASSFREKKGIPYGLRALARLRRECALEVTLVGNATRDPGEQKEKQNILDTLGETGLGDVVRMTGFMPQDNLFAEALRHDVYLAPSVTAENGDMEGLPFAILEMLASGIPVVTSRHADIPDAAIHDETALLADERDEEGLYVQLRRLLLEPGLRDRLVRQGRDHMERQFDLRSQNRALSSIYRTVIGMHEVPGDRPFPAGTRTCP